MRKNIQGEEHGTAYVYPAQVCLGLGIMPWREVNRNPASCSSSPVRIRALGVRRYQPVLLWAPCRAKSTLKWNRDLGWLMQARAIGAPRFATASARPVDGRS